MARPDPSATTTQRGPAGNSRAASLWRGARVGPVGGCIIRVVIPAIGPFRVRPRAAHAAGALLLAVGIAACGSSVPTPPPGVTSAATPSPGITSAATNSPTAAANESIVPVPTSQLVVASGPSPRLDTTKAAALQAALDGIRNRARIPGASAAILFPDGSIWTGVSGAAVISPAAPVTADTLFSVGSISKTFVAALAGRLAMAGTIGLDDPLSKYVPTFPNAANITIRELLNHTSGIKDLFEIPAIASAIVAQRSATWTSDRVLSMVGSLRYFAPGTGYHYSNTDFVLLGLVIEKATGQTVAALVRSTFLTPLGLSHTYLQTEEEAQGSEAHGYLAPASRPVDNSAGTMLPFTAEATAAGFSGAYVSTASDLAVWANALYGGQILDQATLASMVDISPSLAFKIKPPFPYGLGFEETTVAGQLAWGHRGHLDGFWSAMEYLPAYHVTIVVLTNANWATDPVSACSSLGKIAIA